MVMVMVMVMVVQWLTDAVACLHLPPSAPLLPASIVSLCANLFETIQDARLLLPLLFDTLQCASSMIESVSLSCSFRFCEHSIKMVQFMVQFGNHFY